MLYNPAKKIDIQNAYTKLKYYIDKGKIFELKVKRELKSANQNKYFHLIVGWFALEYGEDAEYVKQEIIKKIVCPEVFKYERINEKNGEIREAYKSFSSIDKEQTTYVIDKFRDYSAKTAGIYLPEPSDLVALQEIEVQLKNNERYL